MDDPPTCLPDQELLSRGIDIEAAPRGGEITYHVMLHFPYYVSSLKSQKNFCTGPRPAGSLSHFKSAWPGIGGSGLCGGS
eukprot:scaffold239867_cov19-Tisochrysis_lutea.AAC.1